MSEENGTFICELKIERDLYLRKLKQLKIKSLSSLQSCLLEASRVIIKEIRRFFISMYWDKWLILHHNFWCFKYLLLRFRLFFIYCQDAPYLFILFRSWQLASVYTITEHRNFLRQDHLYNVLTLGMILSQRISMFFDSVNTGELPTSECNRWMGGISKVYVM